MICTDTCIQIVNQFFIGGVVEIIKETANKNCFDTPRQNRFNTHSNFAQLKSQAFAPAFQSPFAGMVNRAERKCNQSANGCSGYKKSALFLPEIGNERLCNPNHA